MLGLGSRAKLQASPSERLKASNHIAISVLYLNLQQGLRKPRDREQNAMGNVQLGKKRVSLK